MKIIIMFLILFIPNVFAESDGLSCSYDINGDTINFGIYVTSSGDNVISNFIVDGMSYNNYFNKTTKMEELKCPTLGTVSFYGDSNLYYYLVNSRADINLLITNGEIIYNDDGVAIGQIKDIVEGKKINSIEYTHYDTKDIVETDGISDTTRKQMNLNIEAYSKDICTYQEKTAIAEYFNTNDYYSISTFYGDNVFKRKNEYIKLTDECALVATNLYNSTISLVHMLSDYVDDGGDTYTINFLSLQSGFYAGQAALTTPWYDVSFSEDVCNVISDDVRNILNYLFDSFRLICIILTIFLTYLDGMKSLAAKDDSATKKWISNTIKRMISLIIILMLPLLINLVLDLVNKYMSNSYVYVDGECIKAITGG